MFAFHLLSPLKCLVCGSSFCIIQGGGCGAACPNTYEFSFSISYNYVNFYVIIMNRSIKIKFQEALRRGVDLVIFICSLCEPFLELSANLYLFVNLLTSVQIWDIIPSQFPIFVQPYLFKGRRIKKKQFKLIFLVQGEDIARV